MGPDPFCHLEGGGRNSSLYRIFRGAGEEPGCHYSKHAGTAHDKADQLYDWAEQVKLVIEQRFKSDITIGISEIRTGLGCLASGYTESLKALEYSILLRINRFYCTRK